MERCTALESKLSPQLVRLHVGELHTCRAQQDDVVAGAAFQHLREVTTVTVRYDAVPVQPLAAPASNADVLLARQVVLVPFVSSPLGLETQADSKLPSLHAATAQLVQIDDVLPLPIAPAAVRIAVLLVLSGLPGLPSPFFSTSRAVNNICELMVDVPEDPVDLDVAELPPLWVQQHAVVV